MTLYKQARCFICTHEIWAERVDDVHCLWGDEEWHGRPVCWSCYWILKWHGLTHKLDVPIKSIKFVSGQMEMGKWL